MGRRGTSRPFNGTLRDEWLNEELFFTLQEAQVLVERWRRQVNPRRPLRARGSAPGPSGPHGHTIGLSA